MERSSSSTSSDQVRSVDWISKLPNDVLLMILSRLSTKEAIRTSLLSKQWEHVWKHVSSLVFDKPKLVSSTELCDEPNPDDTLITKVINNHQGHIESCILNYSSSQGLNGILKTWIQSITSVKHTKVLTLIRHYDCLDRTGKVFEFPSNSFSHPSLMSLSLMSYTFRNSHPFRNCSNLRTLKLVSIGATNVEVFNTLFSSCPSLEVLVLYISCTYDIGVPLKIENNDKLKLLHVLFMHNIGGGLRVSSTSLNILVIDKPSFEEDSFFLCAPRLQFSRKFFAPHISYNISKEEKSIAHEEFVNSISSGLCKSIALRCASVSVSVNLMNRTEVETLRQVLGLWIRNMRVLEITFKDNNNATNESWEKKMWEEVNNNNVAFPNSKFRVKTLWMPNFSGSEEEFAFASCLIKHGTVIDEMKIKTSSFPARKRMEIGGAVKKLRALQTEEDQLMIKCF